MSYISNNPVRNRPEASRVTLMVFRQSKIGDHEVLVGRSVDNPAEGYRLPIRDVYHEDGQPPQREEHAARCLGEAVFNVDMNSSQVDIGRSTGLTDENENLAMRGFPVRATAEWEAVARDGRQRVVEVGGRQRRYVFQFVPISVFNAQRDSLIPELGWINTALENFLNHYISIIEPTINALTPPPNYR
ncbi:hypothetical protein F5Y08DRAFT_311089 [Xylaria arbuscula]|nr:hypothetical protein F5Y08DRAFT_311089 [Xylaria arbuscula]